MTNCLNWTTLECVSLGRLSISFYLICFDSQQFWSKTLREHVLWFTVSLLCQLNDITHFSVLFNATNRLFGFFVTFISLFLFLFSFCIAMQLSNRTKTTSSCCHWLGRYFREAQHFCGFMQNFQFYIIFTCIGTYKYANISATMTRFWTATYWCDKETIYLQFK